MIPRVTFLLLLVLSLAIGPVRGMAACGAKADAGTCHSCCTDPAAACCSVSSAPAPVTPPAQTAPAGDEGRQMPAPTLTVLGLIPAPVLERPAFHKLQAARMPVTPRLALTCIRLI